MWKEVVLLQRNRLVICLDGMTHPRKSCVRMSVSRQRFELFISRKQVKDLSVKQTVSLNCYVLVRNGLLLI
jgi:hypothetical protein